MLLSDGTELVFRVREHANARRVRIVFSRRAGMVVTIPRGFDRQRIPQVLEQYRSFIEQALRRYPMRPESFRLPERIVLQAIGEEWTIEYEAGNSKLVGEASQPRRVVVTLAQRGEQQLHISGAIDRPEVVRRVLQRWLVLKARPPLIPWLRSVAQELGFPLKGATVRFQRTLWASCSHRDTVSLNARLLLIPPGLVRYVFIHELAHTRHRNHSREFWQVVAAHVPDFRAKRKELQRLWNALEI
jgi:predicted metal-dependent hydrolase